MHGPTWIFWANLTAFSLSPPAARWVGAVPFGLSADNRTGAAACCDPGCDEARAAPTSDKAVRLAQKMQDGPRIPVWIQL